MSDDRHLRDALLADEHEPRPDFRTDLRARLSDEWHGRAAAGPAVSGRPWWWFGAAAAAVVAVVVSGLVWFAGRDNVSSPTDTVPAPGTTLPVGTLAPTTAPAPPALDPQGGVDGPVVYWRQRTDGSSEDALGVGTLTLDDECLLLDTGIARFMVLWEFGTVWDAAARAVVAPDGTVLPVGTAMQAGGGFHPATTDGGIDAWTSSAAARARVDACAGVNEFGEVLVVQDTPRPATATESWCLPDEPAPTAVPSLLANMAAVRRGMAELGCVVESDLFTGIAPACWGPCDDGTSPTIAVAYANWGEVTDPSGATWWTASVPVSYPDGLDVVEQWELRSGPDGWQTTVTSIDPPLPERAASAAVIDAFLGHLAAAEWEQATDLLLQGGADIPDRIDVQELQPATFDRAGVAAALATWCAVECDTAPLDSPADLTFTGGYELTRNGQTLRATWYEGQYGVSGTPFRTAAQPLVGAAALTAWPDPPLPAADALDRLPYYLPAPLPELTARRSAGVTDSLPTPTFRQVWFDATADAVLEITTTIGRAPNTDPSFRRPVEVAGWNEAFFVDGADGVAQLTLGAGSVTVQLTTGGGLDEQVLLTTANRLTGRAPGTAGWDLGAFADEWMPFGEGWNSDYALHNLLWTRDTDQVPVGELAVGIGAVELLMTNQLWADRRQLVEVDGQPAILTETAGVVVVVWHPEPELTARFGWYGPVTEALAVLDSLELVDRATWEAAADPFGAESDGCSGLFC